MFCKKEKGAFNSLIDSKKKIVWNPAYRVEVLDDESVFFISEHEKFILKGRAIAALTPFLKSGNFSPVQLVSKMRKEFLPEKIYFILTELEKKALVQVSGGMLSNEVAAYCGLLNVSEQDAYDRLSSIKVFVDDTSLRSALKQLSIQLATHSHQADFSIVCVHDYLQLEAFKEYNQPWLLCKPYGSEIWIGPFFEPGKRECYECLATSLKINRLEEAYIQKKLQLKTFHSPSHAQLETTKQFAWNFIATEIFKAIVQQKNEFLEGKIHTFNTINLQKGEHVLVKRPTCKACGCSSFSSKSPTIALESKKKREGSRFLLPEETIKKFESYVGPITGAIKYLESSTLGAPFHVYYSGSNYALSELQKEHHLNSFRRNTGGKGISEIAAKASGLCEALERLSGTFHGDERHIFASYNELKEEAVHPQKALLFSETQYSCREKLNAEAHSFWKIAAPFPDKEKMAWAPFFSFTENRVKYFPTCCSYFKVPVEKGGWKGHVDSNGCAAGNCLEEAILHGFLELIERDSIAIWWYNRLECPSVDLESFQDPYMQSVLHEYALRNREVWVLDVTTDLGIPSFVALSRFNNKEEENIYMGFGAHLDAKFGILRALTEMNQFLSVPLFWEKSSFGEGKQDLIDKKIVSDWMKFVKVKNFSYLKNDLPMKKASDYKSWQTDDFLEDICFCQKIVENCGMEFLALDQTRPEIDCSVARVIVPGLRHFWPRFAPGRLYDVPVKMGKRSILLKEHELNPLGMFL